MPPFRTTEAEHDGVDDHPDHLSPDSSPSKMHAAKTSRLPFWSAVVLTGVITAASFVLSFAALWDLSLKSGSQESSRGCSQSCSTVHPSSDHFGRVARRRTGGEGTKRSPILLDRAYLLRHRKHLR